MYQEHECVICLDSIKKDDEYQAPCCNQYFHTQCLKQWTNSQTSKFKTCPHCREDLDCLNVIKIKNFRHSNILENFNFKLEVDISGYKYLVTNIKKFPSGVVQSKINFNGIKKTVPIYIFDAEFKSLDTFKTIKYFVSLTTIYACLNKISNKCICKQVITYAYLDSLIPDDHVFYHYMASFDKDLTYYNNYLELIKIIN